ncbi:unnamed protein product [Musa textilis]
MLFIHKFLMLFIHTYEALKVFVLFVFELAIVIHLFNAIELLECKKLCLKRAKFYLDLEQAYDSFGRLWDYIIFFIISITWFWVAKLTHHYLLIPFNHML